jgi:isocitrate dehydrogenase (NAD+)
MSKRVVVAMPGDGIGKVVLPEAIRVLDAVGFEAEYVHGDIGWDFWINEGNALPDRTIQLLEKHKLGLFGAITSKPKDKADKELSTDLQGKGYVYYSPIVGLRQHFDLDICIRPCRSFKGNPLNFIRKSRWWMWWCSGKIPKVCTPAWSGRILPNRYAMRLKPIPK